MNLPREQGTSIPQWVLTALPDLTNASDIKVLLFLAARARYRRSAFGPGELADELKLDYRTTTASLKRLGELGYIVSANGVHALRGACTTLAQRLHKSTPTPQPKKAVLHGKNENATSAKDFKGLRRTKKDLEGLKTPPTPQGDEARESAAPGGDQSGEGMLTFPEALAARPDFPAAWDRWLAYRRKRRLALLPMTLTAQLGFLAAQPDPVAVIAQAIEKGWQGLFPLRGGAGQSRSVPAAHRLDDQDWDAVAAEVDANRDRFLNPEGMWN